MWLTNYRRGITALVVLFFTLTHSAIASDRSWNKIRYQGGTIDVKVNPFDWNTALRISATQIELVFAGRKKVTIEARNVLALTYGEAAYRRIVDALAPGGASQPLPLFGIVHMGKDHLVGIEFRGPDNLHGAVLLMVHKDSDRELLRALSELTDKPVEGAP